MLRRVIRSSKLFNKPYEEAPVNAMNGTIIHGDLIILSVANDNFRAYLEKGLGVDLNPVFITYAAEAGLYPGILGKGP